LEITSKLDNSTLASHLIQDYTIRSNSDSNTNYNTKQLNDNKLNRIKNSVRSDRLISIDSFETDELNNQQSNITTLTNTTHTNKTANDLLFEDIFQNEFDSSISINTKEALINSNNKDFNQTVNNQIDELFVGSNNLIELKAEEELTETNKQSVPLSPQSSQPPPLAFSPLTISHQLLPQRNIPQANTFSIDIDPFSSSSSEASSKHSSTHSLNKLGSNSTLQQKLKDNTHVSPLSDNVFDDLDPFGVPLVHTEHKKSNTSNPFSSTNEADPFYIFDNNNNNSKILNKMNNENQENANKIGEEKLNFAQVDEVTNFEPYSNTTATSEAAIVDDGENNDKNELQDEININEIEISKEATLDEQSRLQSDEYSRESNENEHAKRANESANDGDQSDSSDDSYSVPPPLSKTNRHSIASANSGNINIRDPFAQLSSSNKSPQSPARKNKNHNNDNTKANDDEGVNDDEMDFDNAFTNYADNKLQSNVEDLPSFANELNELSLNDENDNFNDQMDMALRRGDVNNIEVGIKARSIKFYDHIEQISNSEDEEDEYENGKENARRFNSNNNDIQSSQLNRDDTIDQAETTNIRINNNSNHNNMDDVAKQTTTKLNAAPPSSRVIINIFVINNNLIKLEI
jgi:hypothetical protein